MKDTRIIDGIGRNTLVYLVEFTCNTEEESVITDEEDEKVCESITKFDEWAVHSHIEAIERNARKKLANPSILEEDLEKYPEEMLRDLTERLKAQYRGCMVEDFEHAPGHGDKTAEN